MKCHGRNAQNPSKKLGITQSRQEELFCFLGGLAALREIVLRTAEFFTPSHGHGADPSRDREERLHSRSTEPRGQGARPLPDGRGSDRSRDRQGAVMTLRAAKKHADAQDGPLIRINGLHRAFYLAMKRPRSQPPRRTVLFSWRLGGFARDCFEVAEFFTPSHGRGADPSRDREGAVALAKHRTTWSRHETAPWRSRLRSAATARERSWPFGSPNSMQTRRVADLLKSMACDRGISQLLEPRKILWSGDEILNHCKQRHAGIQRDCPEIDPYRVSGSAQKAQVQQVR
jgi:hypothetical protein